MSPDPGTRPRPVAPARPAADDAALTLSLRQHPAHYRAVAPAFADLLASEPARILAERFEELDEEAVERQDAFRRESMRARTAVLVTSVAAGTLLAAATLDPLLGARAAEGLRLVAAIVSVSAGALAAMWIDRIRRGHLLEAWMSRRAAAEMERLHYFERVTRPISGVDPLLQLEYFCLHHLEVQRNFYRHRSRQHRREAEQTLRFGTLMMAVATIATGLAGMLAAMLHPGWAALAVLGIAGQALAALSLTREASEQNQRNAERYDRTRTALDRLAERLPAVRQAAASGDTAVTGDFVAAVNDQLSVEHRQWEEDLRSASEAVQRLERQLATHAGDRTRDISPA